MGGKPMLSMQKNLLSAMAASTKKHRMALLCFGLILGMTFAVFLPQMFADASNRQTVQDVLNKTSDAVEAADPIYQRLIEIIADEIAYLDIEDDESETDISESEAAWEEMNNFTIQLDGLLSGLKGLPDDLNTSEGKTVCAVKEYLNMIRNITVDMAELVRYNIDVYWAIDAMDNLDDDFDDFGIMAKQLWDATNLTKGMMEQIKPPSYLAITHNDMILRVTEFRDFSDDFDMACRIEDPLRIYSCLYRLNRIVRMFEVCGDNMKADLALQFSQAERRLNGPIGQLREELIRNLDLLKNA
jgi:hypothetical protein